MVWKTTGISVSLALCCCVGAMAQEKYNIVTGSQNGIYGQIGSDLSKLVAKPAGISLSVLRSNGSVENIKRMRDERGTKFALVQSDVYQAFQDQAAAGNAEAARIVGPLRVILPLYDEEVYFVVRADAPASWVHDIRNLRINIGPIGSGTAMTAATLYRLMFGEAPPAGNLSMLTSEEALVKLAKDKTVDVVVVVAGQPTPLFLGMEPGVEKYFKLLRFDESNPASAKALATYGKTLVKVSSYPNWLSQDVPALSVKTLLVTYDYVQKATQAALGRFAHSLCGSFGTLQKEGHPKWRQVNLDLPPLGAGWKYSTATEPTLERCAAARKVPPKPPCALEEKVMRLCVD